MTNFMTLARGGNLYRSLPTALVGAAPKSIVHYSFLTFWMNVLSDGRLDKVIILFQCVSHGIGRC